MHTSLPLRNMPASFINITPLNPLISSCDIKVLYHGKNRNRSLISKGVAEKIAATLPNVPIVGEYLEHIEDFGDHAQEMVINSEGVKMVKRTVPFGVVPADTKIWWQWFVDDDGVEREYLMCKGYLWTGRYPEVNRVLMCGNGQSMEFDPDTMMGQWAIPENETNEYFIVSDAVFTGLCILGEDVEPCFEGAAIGASVVYSLDKDKFKLEMTQFMLDLKSALYSEEGGTEMDENNILEDSVVETTAVEETVTVEETIETPGQVVETESMVEPNTSVEEVSTVESEGEFAKKKQEGENPNDPASEEDPKNEDPTDDPKADPAKEEDPKKKKAKYELEEVVEYTELKAEFDALTTKYEALVAELEGIKPELHSLREMKETADTASKNNMIAKFYMLDEEDLKEVRENIVKYSLDEIESKLSVIAVRKKVNFNLDDTSKNETKIDEAIVSFSAQTADNIPAWLRAVESVANRK